MTVTEAPPSDDDGRGKVEFTLEQRERLKNQIGRVYKDLGPEFAFKFPLIDIGTSAIAGIAADVATLSRTALPAGLVNIARPSFFAEKNARLVDQLKPILNVEGVWQRSLPVINSDILKLTGLGQSNLTAIAAQLVNGADFGWTGQLAQITKLYGDQQTNWLKAIAPALATLRDSFLPSNLQDIKEPGLEDIEQVVMLDGIGLYEVPRAAIADKLVGAAGSSARRAILGRNWREIGADCRGVLESCRSSEALPMVRFAIDAVDALEAGNSSSAQSLASSLLDTILRKYLPKTKPLIVPSKKTKSADGYLNFSVRQYIVLAPIWQAYQSYYPDNGDRVPRMFNRHATAHTVGSQQYSRRNAVQGLMLVCGLLKFLDEQASALAAA